MSGEVVITMGEAYSGRTVLSRRAFKEHARLSTVRVNGEVTVQSMHALCKALNRKLSDGQSVVVDDEAMLGTGGRRAVIDAARKASAEIRGVYLSPLGGDLQRVWAREWARVEVSLGGKGVLGSLGDSTFLAKGRLQAGVDASLPTIGEGFDVLQAVTQPLVSSIPHEAIALLLDAASIVNPLTPENPALTLKEGLPALLHGWFAVDASTKVVVVLLPAHATFFEAVHKGGEGSTSYGDMVSGLLGALRGLAAPFPVYVYGVWKGSQGGSTEPGALLKDPTPLFPTATTGMSAADVAYLQHRHALNLDYVFLCASKSSAPSSSTRFKALSSAVGLRTVNLDDLLPAVKAGASVPSVLKKIAERHLSRRPRFLKAVASSYGNPYEAHNYDETEDPFHHPLPPVRAYPMLPALARGKTAQHWAVQPRISPNSRGVVQEVTTVHGVIISPHHAKQFIAALPKEESLSHNVDDVPAPIPSITFAQVQAYFGADLTSKGQKFVLRGMVDFDSWQSDDSEARLTCKSADASKSYGISLKLLPGRIVAVQCECGKEVFEGTSRCRHAAAGALHVAHEGIPVQPAVKAEESSTRETSANTTQRTVKMELDCDDEGEPSVKDEVDQGSDVAKYRGPTSLLEGDYDFMYYAKLQGEGNDLPDLTEPLAEDEQSKLMKNRVKSSSGGRSLPWHMLEKMQAKKKSPPKAPSTPSRTVASGKGLRGPNAPKRPVTAYFHFLNDVRDEVRKANPGVGVAQLAKIQGELWGKLGDDERKKYHTRAKEDKERYNKEQAAYEKTEEYMQVFGEALRQKEAAERSRKEGKAKVEKKPPKAPAPPERDADGLSQFSDASFYARFQKNTGWRCNDDGHWIHEWDDDDDAAGVEASEDEAPEVDAVRMLNDTLDGLERLDNDELKVKEQPFSPSATFDVQAEIAVGRMPPPQAPKHKKAKPVKRTASPPKGAKKAKGDLPLPAELASIKGEEGSPAPPIPESYTAPIQGSLDFGAPASAHKDPSEPKRPGPIALSQGDSSMVSDVDLFFSRRADGRLEKHATGSGPTTSAKLTSPVGKEEGKEELALTPPPSRGLFSAGSQSLANEVDDLFFSRRKEQ